MALSPTPLVSPPADSAPRPWVSRATEAIVLFPAIAVLGLVVIAGATFNLIREERATAQDTAASFSRELTETYEAQVVRAVREIDQTLKFVRYAYERGGQASVLRELKEKALLPPDLFCARHLDACQTAVDCSPSVRPRNADPGSRFGRRTGQWEVHAVCVAGSSP